MKTIILDSTTKTLKAKLSGAPATTNPDFVVSWADSSASAFSEGSTDGALNGSTEVTIVAAPAASTRRVIKDISIVNRDTAAVILSIIYNNNGTKRIIANVTLDSGDKWTPEGVYNSSGSFKGIGSNGIRGYSNYEIAVQNGYAGTEAEWLATMNVDTYDVGDLVQIFQNGLV